ncbi:GldM family protein [Lewinella sp. 4G2]|uniref:type IX secretion system motor protein PorM/GldM n=1 Tax=Lewinella sp. 4G2 TaxID=1803372 RepID=UPI0007B4EA0B|nr:GldM family protein [Lewinella sp. 4G2]OAV44211.1 hypothetical protein A3850_006755 [Lewinella sp. 4G2]
MSIPKEPRQLMINIMYLVLMALLALNVSAEVMNAFHTLDEGNKNSIATVNEQLKGTVEGLDGLLKDDSKAKFRPIQPAIANVRAISDQLSSYVTDLSNELIDLSGNNNNELDEGDYKDYENGVIKGKKNKDVPTRVLVYGEDGAGGEPGKGEDLKNEIQRTADELIAAYSALLTEHGETFGLQEAEIQTRINNVKNNMPLAVDDEEWRNAADKKESWADYKFGHMPVAAVLPLLSQIQSDLKSTEANMINDMVSLAGGRTIEIDKFFPVFSADRSYVISGEKINAKVSVGSYSSSLDPSNVRLTVNGQALRLNADGTADYSITGTGSGQKSISTAVAVTNPLTGEVTRGEGKFTYEVGQRSVAVSADKMNVFYMGVENPLTVSAAGVPSGDVRVNVSGAAQKKSGSGSKFIITGTSQGEATVTVSAKGQNLGTFPFRVKRIPNPVPVVGNSKGGKIPITQFKGQKGIFAKLESFDFDARCEIAGYELVYVPKRDDPLISNNAGQTFNQKSKQLIARARPGDSFYANNIKARCPGDQGPRALGSIAFQLQ